MHSRTLATAVIETSPKQRRAARWLKHKSTHPFKAPLRPESCARGLPRAVTLFFFANNQETGRVLVLVRCEASDWLDRGRSWLSRPED